LLDFDRVDSVVGLRNLLLDFDRVDSGLRRLCWVIEPESTLSLDSDRVDSVG
jgi:hypothetical protein